MGSEGPRGRSVWFPVLECVLADPNFSQELGPGGFLPLGLQQGQSSAACVAATSPCEAMRASPSAICSGRREARTNAVLPPRRPVSGHTGK